VLLSLGVISTLESEIDRFAEPPQSFFEDLTVVYDVAFKVWWRLTKHNQVVSLLALDLRNREGLELRRVSLIDYYIDPIFIAPLFRKFAKPLVE